MKIIRKIRNFLKLERSMKWLLLEAYWELARGRYLKSIPFSKVAPSLGEQMKETPQEERAEHRREIVRVSRAIHLMSRYTFWESECLVKAFAGMRMLERRGIESTLYMGTAKDENGELIAHAWLRSGPFYVSGAEVMRKFTVVAIFGKVPASPSSGRFAKV